MCESCDANSSAILIRLSKEIASQESPDELFLSSHLLSFLIKTFAIHDALVFPSSVVLLASLVVHRHWWRLFLPSFGAYGAMLIPNGESDGVLVVVSGTILWECHLFLPQE